MVDGNQQTAHMMQDDILTEPIPIACGPNWGVPRGPGLGIEINEDKLGKYHELYFRIQQISKDRLEIQQGSLYPALYRLEHQGLIASEWGESENKRKAKYYCLTVAGRRQLHQETRDWNRMADIIARILKTAPEEL